MEDEIIILMIEDEDSAAAIFQFQILENTSLRSRNVGLHHVHDLKEAFTWLSQADTLPHLISLDIGLPDLPRNNMEKVRQVYNDLKKAAPDSKIICLTGLEQENPLFKALADKIGRDAMFSKNDVFQQQHREGLVEQIHQVRERRTSGDSRQRDIAIEKLSGQTANAMEEIEDLCKRMQRIEDVLFMGSGDSSRSLSFVAMRLQQRVDELAAWRSDAGGKISKLEEKMSDGSNQIKVLRANFLYKFMIGVAIASGFALFGVDVKDLLELAKEWLKK